jgi:DNA-binding response OmpR family regulator
MDRRHFQTQTSIAAGALAWAGQAPAPASAQPSLEFRRYALKPEDRLLLRDGRAIDLGGRAFDLLFVLLRSRGNVVSKGEIFSVPPLEETPRLQSGRGFSRLLPA